MIRDEPLHFRGGAGCAVFQCQVVQGPFLICSICYFLTAPFARIFFCPGIFLAIAQPHPLQKCMVHLQDTHTLISKGEHQNHAF